MMEYTFVSALILLILIIDPFGNIPIFANALKRYPAAQRRKIILREHGIAFAILLTFMFVGEAFLKAVGLTTASLQIAGGVILFLIAIRMVFPPPEANEETNGEEPFVVPLAIPIVSGPSSMATVMLLVSQQPAMIVSWIMALSLAVAFSATVLVCADIMQKRLGSKFVVAIEKLMGLILVAISVDMLLRGLKIYLTV
jgi:MarC family membrane protein